MPFRHISVLDRELARGIWIEFDSMGIDTDRKMHGAFAKTRVTDGEYTSAAATRSICVTLRVSRRFSASALPLRFVESVSRSTQKLAKGNVRICPVIRGDPRSSMLWR